MYKTLFSITNCNMLVFMKHILPNFGERILVNLQGGCPVVYTTRSSKKQTTEPKQRNQISFTKFQSFIPSTVTLNLITRLTYTLRSGFLLLSSNHTPDFLKIQYAGLPKEANYRTITKNLMGDLQISHYLFPTLSH